MFIGWRKIIAVFVLALLPVAGDLPAEEPMPGVRFIEIRRVKDERYPLIKFVARNETAAQLAVNGGLRSQERLFVPHGTLVTWEVLSGDPAPKWAPLERFMGSYRSGKHNAIWRAGEELEFYASTGSLMQLAKRRAPVVIRMRLLLLEKTKRQYDYKSEELVIEDFAAMKIRSRN